MYTIKVIKQRDKLDLIIIRKFFNERKGENQRIKSESTDPVSEMYIKYFIFNYSKNHTNKKNEKKQLAPINLNIFKIQLMK